MAGTPFFRGQNRMDWLIAVMLQTACDWFSLDMIRDVSDIIGPATITRFPAPGNLYPTVTLIVTADTIFVVCSSTHRGIQWVGNVLGSSAQSVPPAGGEVGGYFGSTALFYYKMIREDVRSAVASRNLVLIGFSLGGAAATILKDMFSRNDGIEGACVAFGNPRAGTTEFNAGFPADNYAGFGVVNDPVPSVPPAVWSGLGVRNNWTPFPPFVAYGHVVTGTRLNLGGELSPGYPLQPVDEVILGFDLGLWNQFHNQSLYARLLRTLDMPDVITDGFQDYAHAGLTDNTAAATFAFGGIPWKWASPIAIPTGEPQMTIQLRVGIQNRESPARAGDEVYYFSGTDPAAILAQFTGVGLGGTTFPLSFFRQKFLSQSAEIYYAAAAVVGGPRQNALHKYRTPIAGTQGVTENFDDCIAYVGYNSDKTSKRQFHFRAVSNTWITADKLTSIGNANVSLIEEYLQQYFSRSGAILKGSPTPIASGRIIASAAKATQDSNIVLTMSDMLTVDAGTLIEVSGVRQAPLLNAKWLVGGPNVAGSIILASSARFSCPAAINGRVRVMAPAATALTSFAFDSVSNRKSGRPRFLRRGRRSVQIRRR